MIAILKGGLNGWRVAPASPAEALDAGLATWILAKDLDDAVRQAEGLGEPALARELERMRFARAGRHRVLRDYLVLVK